MTDPIQDQLLDIIKPEKPGMELPSRTRADMENFFNASFQEVRIHLDDRLPNHGVLAATRGHDIFMPHGAYSPGSRHFKLLLAHELAHVLQQREGRVTVPMSQQPCLVDDAILESEAENMAMMLAIVEEIGMSNTQNLVARSPEVPTNSHVPSAVVQCILLHAKDALKKVDWMRFTDVQDSAAKKIIENIRNFGVNTLTVTGLNGEKFGHESTGDIEENPTTRSVSVWWKRSFGSPLRDKHGKITSQNSIADGISVCGLGTHLAEYQGKPAYRLGWLVSAGLCERFYINSNTVTRMPSPPKKKDD